jgi:hypothetical protein
MSMKPSTAPRTVYSRNGNLIVCFEGKYFAALAETSAVEPGASVKVENFKSDGGRARVLVKVGKVAEVWRSFSF